MIVANWSRRRDDIKIKDSISSEPLNAGPSCVRICAGLHDASRTHIQKPQNTHGSRNTRRTTRRTSCEEHPNARLLPNNNQHTASKHRALRAVLECIRAPEYESTRAERQHGRKMMKAGPRTDSSTAARTAGPTSNSPQERPCSPK